MLSNTDPSTTDPSFCPNCGAEWRANKVTAECSECSAFSSRMPPPLPDIQHSTPPPLLTSEGPPPIPEALPLTPHKYPLWLVVCAALVCLAAISSMAIVPGYFRAARLLRQGQGALARNEITQARQTFGEVLQIVPSSKIARIEMALAHFRSPSPAEQIQAFRYLQGITLGKSDMRKLRASMPAQYERFFEPRAK